MDFKASEILFALCAGNVARASRSKPELDFAMPLSEDALEQLIESPSLRAQLLDHITCKDIGAELRADTLPFVGRQKLLKRAHQYLRSGTKLLTFSGPRGCGKSRAAREILRELRSFGRCTWHLPCAQIESSEDLVQEVAFLLGDRECESAFGVILLDSVTSDLRTGIAHLLSKYTHLQIIVTTRHSMRIPDEAVLRVGILSYAAARDLLGLAAGELGKTTLPKIGPGFARLPLALILAGSMFGSDAMGAVKPSLRAENVSSALSTQESVVIEALSRLDGTALACLVCLSTLCGPFRIEDAKELVREFGQEDVILQPLINLALVDVAGLEVYEIHDEVRAGVETLVSQLGKESWIAKAADAHARIFLQRATLVSDALKRGDWNLGMSLLLQHKANCRSALRYLAGKQQFDGVSSIAACMCRGLFEAGFVKDFSEFSRKGLDAAIFTRNRNAELELLGLTGAFASRNSDDILARETWERRLSTAIECGDMLTASDSLEDLAHLAFCDGDLAEAERLANRSLSICRTSHHVGHQATSLAILARVHHAQGLSANVAESIDKIEQLIPNCEDKMLLPFIHFSLSSILLELGRTMEAELSLREHLRLSHEGNRAISMGWSLRMLGKIYEQEGDLARAAKCFVASCKVHNEFATKHRETSRMTLHEFENRHAFVVANYIQEEQTTSWMALVEELLV